MDVRGHYGGLALGWDSRKIQMEGTWSIPLTLGTDGLFVDLGSRFTFLNIYGSHNGRVNFWSDLLNKPIVKRYNLILGGDMNFSIKVVES